jgi:hypothetical protein
MNTEPPVKRIKIEGPANDRRKRKAEVLEEAIELTPMEIDVRPPFVFFPMPQLIRSEKRVWEN